MALSLAKSLSQFSFIPVFFKSSLKMVARVSAPSPAAGPVVYEKHHITWQCAYRSYKSFARESSNTKRLTHASHTYTEYLQVPSRKSSSIATRDIYWYMVHLRMDSLYACIIMCTCRKSCTMRIQHTHTEYMYMHNACILHKS